jgi:hypothetical protein
MKKFTLMLSLFAVLLLAGCENPIYQWLLPEKNDSPLGPLDVNNGWDSSKWGSYMHSLQAWGGDGEVYLSWISPSETEFDHVRIIYSDSAEEIQSKAARTVFPVVIATEGGG